MLPQNYQWIKGIDSDNPVKSAMEMEHGDLLSVLSSSSPCFVALLAVGVGEASFVKVKKF